MRFFSPLRKLWKDWQRAEQSAIRQRVLEQDLYPRLYESRLEDRRLLDASPLVQLTSGGVLTVGGGALAGDGHADQFAISQTQGENAPQVQVRVNGEQVGTFAKSSVNQIRVVGSADADTLVLDPTVTPRDGIVFEGAGGSSDALDTLILQTNVESAPQATVDHVLGARGGTVTMTSSDGQVQSAVQYVGVERIEDRLAVAARSFELEDGVSARLTGGEPAGHSSLVTSSGTAVAFTDPTTALQVTALGRPSASADEGDPRLAVDGTLSISGGDLFFDAGAAGFLDVSATLTTSTAQPVGQGGRIALLGDHVFVRAGSVIEASGDAGGGEILVGGDWQGSNTSIHNARQTLVESGASLTADAWTHGDGGRIIVWADDVAVIHGDISARGGELSGNGGFVETSGRRNLVITQAPDLRAPQGRGGEWLIDPNNLEIVSGTVATKVSIVGSSITTTDDGAKLGVDNLRTALNGGASVTISTSAAGTNLEAGDITLSANLDFNGRGKASLTLNAHRNIILDASIFDSDVTNDDDALNLTFDANLGGVGGRIFLNNSTIDSRNGAITFKDAVVLGKDVVVDARNNSPAGAAIRFEETIDADDSAANNRKLTVNAGAATVTFAGAIGGSGALADLDATGSSLSLGGNVTVDDQGGNQITFTGPVVLAANVVIDTDGAAVDNRVRFGGAIDAEAAANNRELLIRADLGDVQLDGAVGAGAALAVFSIDSADHVKLQDVTVAGTAAANTINLGAVTALGGLTLQGNLRTDGGTNAGNIRLNATGAVTLDAPGAGSILLRTDASGTDGNVVLVGGKNVASLTPFEDGLALAVGGNAADLSGATASSLDHLIITTDAAQTVALGALALGDGAASGGAGALSITAGTTILQGNINTGGEAAGLGGDIQFASAVQLGANITLSTVAALGSGDVQFVGAASTVNADAGANNRQLKIVAGAGDVRFEGEVGGDQPLALLRIDSAANVVLQDVTVAGTEVTDTIDLGAASPLGILTLQGDLRTDGGTNAGNVRINSTSPVLLDAAGGAGSIVIDTDAAGMDGVSTFVGGVVVRSGTPFEDGLRLEAGSRSLDFATAVFSQLDHLVVTTATDQTVTLATVNLGDGAGASGQGALRVTTGTTHLRGDVFTDQEAVGGDVVFQSDVQLEGAVAIVTQASGADGAVTFGGAARADDSSLFNRSLNVSVGGATVVFRSDIGTGLNGALADLDVLAGTIRLGQSVGGASVIVVNDATTGQTVVFDGAVILENNVSINTDAPSDSDNNVRFVRNVQADDASVNDRTLQVAAGTGTVEFAGTLGVGGALADLDVSAALTQLGGDLQVDDQGGNTVTFTGPVRLNADIRIDTAGPADNHLLFLGSDSTIAADAAANQRSLTVDAGGADVTFGGNLGAGERLGAVTVAAARNLTVSGGIAAVRFQQQGGSGDALFNGALDTSGPLGVSVTTHGAVTVVAGITTTGGGTVTFAQGNGLTLNGDIFADGAIVEQGSGIVKIGTTRSITTTGDTITFNGAVQMTGGASGQARFDTTFGGQAAGNDITFHNTVNASTAAPNAEQLLLNAGAGGNITFENNVGGVAPFAAIEIAGVRDFTVGSGLAASSLTQQSGAGDTSLTGKIFANGAAGVSLATSGEIILNDSVTTAAGGAVVLTNGKLLTINADIFADGAVRQSGAGDVVIIAPRQITTTGDIISFQSPVELAGGDAGLVGVNSAMGASLTGADILFSGTIDARTAGPLAEQLELDAGTAGNIEFRGAVGGTTPLGGVVIDKAQDVRELGGVAAQSFEQLAGGGVTELRGSVHTTGATGIYVKTDGAIIVVRQLLAEGDANVSLVSGGDVSLLRGSEIDVTGDLSTNLVSIQAGQNLSFDPTARIRVGTGANQALAGTARPALQVDPIPAARGDSLASNGKDATVSEDGTAKISITMGTPASPTAPASVETNLKLSIEWEKNIFGPSIPPVAPGYAGGGNQIDFSYQYISNPSSDATAPIPIIVTLAFDPRIQLFAQGGATQLSVAVVNVLLLPPASGLRGFNVVTPIDTTPIVRQTARPLNLTIVPAATPLPVVQRYEMGASSGMAATVRTRQILLHVVFVDPQGKLEESKEPIVLEDGDLDNLPELFQSLPDQHYRIYMKMENGSRRLIKDFTIRDRKAVDLEASPDAADPAGPGVDAIPPTAPGGTAPKQRELPKESGEQTRRQVAPRGEERPSVESGAAFEERRSTTVATTTLLASSLAAAATVLSQRDVESWNDQVRRTLRASAGKLRRRLGQGSGHT